MFVFVLLIALILFVIAYKIGQKNGTGKPKNLSDLRGIHKVVNISETGISFLVFICDNYGGNMIIYEMENNNKSKPLYELLGKKGFFNFYYDQEKCFVWASIVEK